MNDMTHTITTSEATKAQLSDAALARQKVLDGSIRIGKDECDALLKVCRRYVNSDRVPADLDQAMEMIFGRSWRGWM